MRRFLAAAAALLLLGLGSQTVLAQYQPNGTLTLSSGSADPGSEVTVSGTGFAPGSPVQIIIESASLQLATVTTDSSGAFSNTVTIPATLAGVHTISAIGVDPGGSLRVLSSPITVSAAPATSTALLSDPAIFAIAGAGIVLLAGLLLLGTQLRRSRR